LKYARPVSVLFILISLSVFILLRLLAKEKPAVDSQQRREDAN